MSPVVRRLSMLMVAVLSVVGLLGCSGSDPKRLEGEATETTVEAPSTTEGGGGPVTTLRPEVTIAGVPRATTTLPASLGPGQARLSGTVTGPSGPVDGAVVRVERFVGTKTAVVEVETDGGSWFVDAILGGAYRVQAFRPPDLAQGQATTFFLGASESKVVDLSLLRYGDNTLTATLDPNPPVVGQETELVVTSADSDVDATGRLVRVGRPGVRMQLVSGSAILLESPALTVTDGEGRAVWRFRCGSPGALNMSVLISGSGAPLALPPCVAA